MVNIYLRSGGVHSKQKQSVPRLREANWFPQSPTIVQLAVLSLSRRITTLRRTYPAAPRIQQEEEQKPVNP